MIRHFIHLIVLLSPVFNCSYSVNVTKSAGNFNKILLSFSVDKVTTRTYNFVSVILNVTPIGLLITIIPASFLVSLLVNTYFSDQSKVKTTS